MPKRKSRDFESGDVGSRDFQSRETVSLYLFGYNSEWALAKFLPAVFNGLSNRFELKAVCGLECCKYDAIKSLEKAINIRDEMIANRDLWRSSNTQKEKDTASSLKDRLLRAGVKYHTSLNGDVSNLPRAYNLGAGKKCAAAIFTKNTTHLQYIQSVLAMGLDLLCEKPVITVTDENHVACRREFDKLVGLVAAYPQAIMMDSEHYAGKIATIVFENCFDEMVKKYGKVSRIEAHSKEVDNPCKPRTMNLLSRKNRTGLLLDMGPHLYGVVVRIGGEIKGIDGADYGIYSGEDSAFDVETYVKTSFHIRGENFHAGAKGIFTIAKFIDRMETKEDKDDKKFEVYFKNENNETKVTLDFNAGTVKDDSGVDWVGEHNNLPSRKIALPADYASEYHVAMSDFLRSILERKQPRTGFLPSILALDAICRTYEQYPVSRNLNSRVYVRNGA